MSIFSMGWEQIWEDPIEWFLNIPLLAQILISIVLLVIAIAVLVLVIYILTFIFRGLYKIIKTLFRFITGMPKKIATLPARPPIISENSLSNAFEVSSQTIPYYCTECGKTITESLRTLLVSGGTAFCLHCGKELKLKRVE